VPDFQTTIALFALVSAFLSIQLLHPEQDLAI
jgi:hypothetical protein